MKMMGMASKCLPPPGASSGSGRGWIYKSKKERKNKPNELARKIWGKGGEMLYSIWGNNSVRGNIEIRTYLYIMKARNTLR